MSELCTTVLWGYHIICQMIGEGQRHWWGRQEFRLIPPLSQWVALALVMTQREHDIPAIAMARDKLRMLALCCHSLKPTSVCGSTQDFFLSAFSPILLCPLPDITRKRNKTEGKQIKKPCERESRKRFFILPLESQCGCRQFSLCYLHSKPTFIRPLSQHPEPEKKPLLNRRLIILQDTTYTHMIRWQQFSESITSHFQI